MTDQIPAIAAPAWLDRTSFPYPARFLPTRHGAVHYVDEGRGEPVLLVHGTPSWSFEYRHLIGPLSRTRRVIAFDHLGFGLSERPRDFAYTPEAHAGVLREVVDGLGLSRFSLVVHDFGGPIALPLAAAEPERIASLTILNSWIWGPASDPELARRARWPGTAFGRFLYRYFNASLRLLMPYGFAERRRLTPEIHRQYLAPFAEREARVRVLWTLARSLLASNAHFERLWSARQALRDLPALIVWGLGDRALPPYMLERLRQALPEARVAALPGVGHWPQEEAPDELLQLLDGFLPRSAGPRAKLLSA